MLNTVSKRRYALTWRACKISHILYVARVFGIKIIYVALMCVPFTYFITAIAYL